MPYLSGQYNFSTYFKITRKVVYNLQYPCNEAIQGVFTYPLSKSRRDSNVSPSGEQSRVQNSSYITVC